jgi:hypothetical protein
MQERNMDDAKSRRRLLKNSASVLAVVGVALQSTSSIGDLFVPTDVENAKKPSIPFSSARSLTAGLVRSEVIRSEKDFGIKYSQQEIENIQNNIWERTHLVMLQYYTPKESQ